MEFIEANEHVGIRLEKGCWESLVWMLGINIIVNSANLLLQINKTEKL